MSGRKSTSEAIACSPPVAVVTEKPWSSSATEVSSRLTSSSSTSSTFGRSGRSSENGWLRTVMGEPARAPGGRGTSLRGTANEVRGAASSGAPHGLHRL